MSKKIPNKTAKSRTKPQSGAFSVNPTLEQVGELNRTSPLYRFVYASQTSMVLVLLLLSSFLLQGIERVYADEIVDVVSEPLPAHDTTLAEDVEESSVRAEEVVLELSGVDETVIADQVINDVEDIPTGNDVLEVDDDPIGVASDSQPQDEIIETAEILNTDEDGGEVSGSESNTAPEEEEFLLGEDVSEVAPADDDEVNVESAAGDDDNEDAIPEVAEDDLTESDLFDDVTIDTTLVATNTVIAAEVLSYTESDSVFSFSKEECTELATGSFYCHKPQENELKDALFAAPDVDGDLEIYLVRDGVQTQVTSNLIDDAAPYYDQNSHTIVWHRLINDRYQIVSYDIDEGSEQVLTNTAENNMEPTRQGDFTVWQRWIDGGWNIILFDGQREMQITKTTSHNVAPYIHGSLVVWNRHDQVNERTIEMYDMESRTYVTVEDPDGMSVSNPRMVFVYDSLHPNGDIVTKGYDVLARKFIELDSLPRELPEEIPNSDSTGETRALIQLKPNGKSEIEEVLPVPDTTANTATSSSSVATTTIPVVLEALTLDLTTATATEPVPEIIVSNEMPPEQLDLIIEPYIASSSTTLESVQE